VIFVTEVLTNAIRAGTAVGYVSVGEVIGQRSGVINLGAEGSMLAGALTAFALTAWTGNPWYGVMCGGISGALMSLIHAFVVITRNANQLATGLAIMFFGQGITAYFGSSYVNLQISGFEPIALPFLSDIPIIGSIFFHHDILTYLSMLMVPLVWVFLFSTKWGVILRATGERDEVVYAHGKSPNCIRYMAVVVGGFFAGVGGAQLSIAFSHSWMENITQGRGLIGVILVIFASWRPERAMLGAYLFGGSQALIVSLQGRGYNFSSFLLFMIPYILTIVVLVMVERTGWNPMPEALKKVFGRG
jgi:simple sugar transport system permease protein|tara:strand:+ start:3103 stop:4011 length:909 start_codon:yes stop_codon:yes gene_type:complete